MVPLQSSLNVTLPGDGSTGVHDPFPGVQPTIEKFEDRVRLMQLLLIVVRLRLLFLIPSLFVLIKYTVFFLCIWKFGVLEFKKHAMCLFVFLSVYYFPSSFFLCKNKE